MRIEFLRHYGIYLPGAVTDAIADGVADVLIRRGIAAAVVAPAAESPGGVAPEPGPAREAPPAPDPPAIRRKRA